MSGGLPLAALIAAVTLLVLPASAPAAESPPLAEPLPVAESPPAPGSPPAVPVPLLTDRAGATPAPDPDPASAADRLAGVVTSVVPAFGTGATAVVPGVVPAPGPGPVRTVRIEVEVGVPVDATAFAGFVMATLNDPRGWGHGGAAAFARTDADAEIVVVLASPDTSAAMCRPLQTFGKLSCRSGPRAVLTHYRWVDGHPDYGGDHTAYRHYVVNHEVGHVLGHGHLPCPGPGAPAPVMQQQTLGLDGCAPNPWPHPA